MYRNAIMSGGFPLNLKLSSKSVGQNKTFSYNTLTKAPKPYTLVGVIVLRKLYCIIDAFKATYVCIFSFSFFFLIGKRMHENKDPWRLLLLCVRAAGVSA